VNRAILTGSALLSGASRRGIGFEDNNISSFGFVLCFQDLARETERGLVFLRTKNGGQLRMAQKLISAETFIVSNVGELKGLVPEELVLLVPRNGGNQYISSQMASEKN
jgi:hypothetical protein